MHAGARGTHAAQPRHTAAVELGTHILRLGIRGRRFCTAPGTAPNSKSAFP